MSSEGQPKVWYFQWSGQSIVIEAEDRSRLTTQRRDQSKRRATAEKRTEAEQKRGGPILEGRVDPLEFKDPWGNWAKPKRELEGASQSSTASGFASVVLGSPHVGTGIAGQDPKLAAPSARVEALESNAVKVECKVGVLDRKVDDMSSSMTQQFQDVLGAIAALNRSQNQGGSQKEETRGAAYLLTRP